jgi:hypothetical protein
MTCPCCHEIALTSSTMALTCTDGVRFCRWCAAELGRCDACGQPCGFGTVHDIEAEQTLCRRCGPLRPCRRCHRDYARPDLYRGECETCREPGWDVDSAFDLAHDGGM